MSAYAMPSAQYAILFYKSYKFTLELVMITLMNYLLYSTNICSNGVKETLE